MSQTSNRSNRLHLLRVIQAPSVRCRNCLRFVPYFVRGGDDKPARKLCNRSNSAEIVVRRRCLCKAGRRRVQHRRTSTFIGGCHPPPPRLRGYRPPADERLVCGAVGSLCELTAITEPTTFWWRLLHQVPVVDAADRIQTLMHRRDAR